MKPLSLTRFELYKLFSRKSLWIILGLLVLCIYLPLQFLSLSGPQTYFQLTPPTATQVQQAQKDEAVIEAKMKSLSPENTHFGSLAMQQQRDLAILDAHKGSAIQGQIEEARKSMADDLKAYGKDSFEYRTDALEYNMLKSLPFVGSGEYLGVGMQLAVFFSMFSPVIFGAIILLGLSTVFSEEYGIGMDSFLLTCKRGKRKLVTAKLLASAIYILVMELILAGVNLISNIIMFGTEGLNYPLQSLEYRSAFHLTILQYFSVALVIQLIGGLVFACLVLLFSSSNRSSLVSFFLSAGTFVLPFLVTRFTSAQWAQNLQTFSYMSLIQVETLFRSFTVFNFFGHPLLPPFAVTSVLILITVPIVWLTYFVYNRHQALQR